MNIRQILPPVIAFTIACAGSTGTVIMRAKLATQPDSLSSSPHPVAADSADAHADTLPDPSVYKVDSVTPASSTPVHKVETDSAPHAKANAPVTAPPAVPVAAAPSAATPLTPPLMVDGRLARMFAAMSARDAAKVFDQMNDADVISLLSAMTDKRAAEVLALLPATRSAVIAKAILARTGTS